MGWQDHVRSVAMNLAGATGEALIDYSGQGGAWEDLVKAENSPKEGPERAPGGKAQDSAENAPVPTEKAPEDPKTLFWDPFAIIEQMGYRDKPSSVTYGTLRAIPWKMPIIQTIIKTRLDQIAAFCRPSRDRYDLGFKIRVKDSNKEPTPAERKWIEQAESLIMRTGVTENPRGRDTFEKFTRKVMRDSLTLDQMCFEVVPNRKGQPAEWYAVDAATIRLADTASTYLDEDLSDAVRYVQIYDGMVISEYTHEDLCFGVRNPRTDIRLFGYGTSEIEMLLTVVTALLWGWEYNTNAFRQGSTQKGILNFKGAIPEKALRGFRRMWYQMISGVENSFKTPITNAEDLQWVNMQTSASDMEFGAWFDFLIKIASAIFTMDPVEINFKYGNVGQKGGLSEASNKEKVIESKERGLRPLLRFYETSLNQHIISPMNENFEFCFVGLDAGTRSETADLNTKRVKTIATVDEIRAEDDKPPLPDGKGEVILDPTWMQWAQMKEGGGEEEGMPGFGGGDDEGDEEEDDDNVIDFQKLLDKQEGEEEKDEKEVPTGKQKQEDKAEKSLRHVVDITL